MKTAITVKSVTHLVETGCADLLVEGILKLQAERDAETKATFEAIRALQEARDEIARLTKAGDAMRYLMECRNDDAYYGEDCEFTEAIDDWNRAKEGKPNG